jgi:hypothetical protein
MGAYADNSGKLIALGFAPIPIKPRTKKPGFLHRGVYVGLPSWQRRFNRGVPSCEVLAKWGEGDTGIGILTGPPSHGAVAVDIDTDDPAIMAAITDVLPEAFAGKRGAKGETLFFYGPAIAVSKSWKIDGKTVVDLIGPGRQTVLPPTLHEDTGLPYKWTRLFALKDVVPDALPLLGVDIVEAITAALVPFGYKVEQPMLAGGNGADDPSPHRELNDAALANLAVWVPDLGLYHCCQARGGYEAVPVWRPSTTGRALEQRHRNLKISSRGIRDFGADEGYTPIDLVMTALGCDLEEAFAFLSERLGLADGVTIELPPVLEPEPKREPPPVAVGSLEPYTHCPGVVGELVDFICATARRPNRVLALATAVTVVGTLIGRRVAGPTRSATHLYTVAVGPTGCGKQHLIDAAIDLMTAAGASGHLGPSEFMSMAAVLGFIIRKPLSLCPQDEYGAFLKRITHKRAATFEASLSKILRTLWGVSFKSMTTAEWADEKKMKTKIIQSPAMSILGVSVADEFHAAMQGESVGNGFLNRYLVLESNLRVEEREPDEPSGKVPDALKTKLRRLYEWSGPSKLMSIDDPEVTFEPEILPWANDEAHACYFEFVRACEVYMDEHSGTKPYLARCSEIAVRLATIRAAGLLEQGGCVTREDMEWGASISWASGQGVVAAAMNYTPGNERRGWYDKILTFIERRGTVKTRDYQTHISGALNSREIKDILSQLELAGHIVKTKDGYQAKKTGNDV